MRTIFTEESGPSLAFVRRFFTHTKRSGVTVVEMGSPDLSFSSTTRRQRRSKKGVSNQLIETVSWVLGALEKDSPFFQQNPPRSLPHLKHSGTSLAHVVIWFPTSDTAHFCGHDVFKEIEVGKLLGTGEFGVVNEVEKFNVTEECHCVVCLGKPEETLSVHKLTIEGIPHETPHHRDRQESIGSRVSFADVPITRNDLEYIQNNTDEVDEPDSSDSDSDDVLADFQLREERGFMRAHCKREGLARYAVKRVKDDVPEIMKEDAAIDLASEAKFLASLSHPNIIKLRAIVGVPGHPDFLMVMDRLYSTMDDNMVHWQKAEKRYRGFLGHFGRRQPDLEHVRIDRMVALYDVARAMKYVHAHK